jgi:archaellum biogenesis ATPase FlaH
MPTEDQIYEALLFLETIFSAEDIIELRPLPGAGQSEWVTLAKVQEALEKLAVVFNDEARRTHAYFGANPRKAAGGSTLDGVLLARCLFADFDGGTSVEQAKIRITDANLPAPTAIVETGNGCHAWWRLSEPITDAKTFTQLQKSLAARLGSDKAVVDFPRIMRLPGFINWKYPTQPRAKLIEVDAGRVYEVLEFEEAKIATQSMSALSRRFLETGYCLPAGRRQTVFTVACDLHARGWKLEHAARLLMVQAAALGLDADALADLPRQIRNAFSKERTPIMDRAEDTAPVFDDTDTAQADTLAGCIHEWLHSKELPTIETNTWLDIALGGLKRGQLVCFTGAPGVGKSALALQIVLDATLANPDLVSAWCLGEMTKTAIAARAIANWDTKATVTLDQAIQKTEAAQAVAENLHAYADRIKIIMPPLNFANMAQVVERSGASILVIDYLQLVNGIDPRADRRTEIDSVIRGVRALAISSNLAVILISNMAKQNGEYRIGNIGKESSEIDYQVDSFFVGEIALDASLLENNKKRITWRCMKNRHGEQKDFTTAFSGAHQQFEILS